VLYSRIVVFTSYAQRREIYFKVYFKFYLVGLLQHVYMQKKAGQMTQSVVIGLVRSDWSDDPVCCDWSSPL